MDYLEAAGSLLIYYNEWSGWEDREQVIRGSLQPWPAGREPLVGDLFWLREDPLHPHGKVYGVQLQQVSAVDVRRVHYSGGFCSREWFLAEARLLEPDARQRLLDFLQNHPEAREI